MHFLGQSPQGARVLADLVVASGIEVFDLCRGPELREAARLMERFADAAPVAAVDVCGHPLRRGHRRPG